MVEHWIKQIDGLLTFVCLFALSEQLHVYPFITDDIDDRRVFFRLFSPLSTSSPIRSSFPPPLIRQTSFSQASRLSSRVSDRTLPSSTPQRPLSTLQLHHSHSKRPSTRSGSMLSGSPVLYSASHPLQSESSSSNGLRNTAPASM